MPKTQKKFHVDSEDIGLDYADCGRWRSYHVTADGDTLEELMADFTVSEVDQDGGEIGCYGPDAASAPVYKAVEDTLTAVVKKREAAEAVIRAAHGRMPAPTPLNSEADELLEATRQAGRLLQLLRPIAIRHDPKLGGEVCECADTIALIVAKAEGRKN